MTHQVLPTHMRSIRQWDWRWWSIVHVFVILEILKECSLLYVTIYIYTVYIFISCYFCLNSIFKGVLFKINFPIISTLVILVTTCIATMRTPTKNHMARPDTCICFYASSFSDPYCKIHLLNGHNLDSVIDTVRTTTIKKVTSATVDKQLLKCLFVCYCIFLVI